MNHATETFAREALAAWEKAASTVSAYTVRDPQVLELGVGMLRAGLLWKSAVDTMTAHMMAPFGNQPGVS